jgi:hypothetical protein
MPTRSKATGAENYLRCRTYGHGWDEFTPIDLEAPWYGWRLSLRCMRCGTERHDNISYGTGQVMGRQYVYPEDYQYHGDDRPTKEVFREELFAKLRAQLKANNALGDHDQDEPATITPIKAVR